ncbi:MAG TPA: flavin reductase family protein [Chloroflexota bacterium]|nr:flavin reductase family protein [Chloroflexota bacterium]
MPLDPQAKETALRQFTTGMTIVGSRGRHGEVNAMTANWVLQISFHPPLVAVAVENDAHTRHLIDASGVFSVNTVRRGPDAEALVGKFVKPAQRMGNKLEDEEFTTGETGAPLLSAALSWVECNVVAAHHHGDHILFVGEVVGAGVNGEGEPLTLADLGWHYGG